MAYPSDTEAISENGLQALKEIIHLVANEYDKCDRKGEQTRSLVDHTLELVWPTVCGGNGTLCLSCGSYDGEKRVSESGATDTH